MMRVMGTVKAGDAFPVEANAKPLGFAPTRWSLHAAVGVIELSVNGTDVDHTLTAGEAPLLIDTDAPAEFWVRQADVNPGTLRWSAGDEEN